MNDLISHGFCCLGEQSGRSGSKNCELISKDLSLCQFELIFGSMCVYF